MELVFTVNTYDYLIDLLNLLGDLSCEWYNGSSLYNEDSALDFIDTVSKFNKRGFYDKLTGYEFDMKLDSLRNQIVNNFYLSQHNGVSQWN